MDVIKKNQCNLMNKGNQNTGAKKVMLQFMQHIIANKSLYAICKGGIVSNTCLRHYNIVHF